MRFQDDESYYKEESWVEFLEKELDGELEEDLRLLLKNSSADRAILDDLRSTRNALKRTDDVALPEDGRYYDQLHDKIMASIDEVAGDASAIPNLRRAPINWTNTLGSAALSLMVALASLALYKATDKNASADADVAMSEANHGLERKLAMLDGSERLAYAEAMAGYGGEMDFFTEVVDQRMRSLDPSQARALMKRLVR